MKETLISKLENIKVYGRTIPEREPLYLFWTGSGIECNVSGKELWIEFEVDYKMFEPWISYTVNGDWTGRQMLPKGRYWIPLFRSTNPDSIKNVRIFKDTQAMSDDPDCQVMIHSLRYDGEFYPVEDKPLKIEFIGDSITSGEGLVGAKGDMDWSPICFSSLRNYTYFTATDLNAEYRIISQSGWGVHCAWDNNINGVLPKYYKGVCSLLKGHNEQNDFNAWQPDFVIVNLGTNDAGSFDMPAWTDAETGVSYKQRRNADGSLNQDDVRVFQEDVKSFIKTLRECNPNAKIIWCYGMIGTPLQLPIAQAVAEYVQETGDNGASYLQLPDTDDSNVGSREHPGELCHRQAADVIVKYIKKLI